MGALQLSWAVLKEEPTDMVEYPPGSGRFISLSEVPAQYHPDPTPKNKWGLTDKEMRALRNSYWQNLKNRVRGVIPSMFRMNHPEESQESVDARRRDAGMNNTGEDY
tara:strand:- start:9813 stop:10133 length:321 start_codon:yes stop_codon:yes gene_type:complete